MLIICKAKAQQDKLILVLGIWYKTEEEREDPVKESSGIKFNKKKKKKIQFPFCGKKWQ